MTELKLLKLVSGDNIVCLLEDNNLEKQFITVKDPVLLNQVRIPRGQVIVESYILSPWASLSDQEEFIIAAQHIITVTGVRESLKENYKTFMESRKNYLSSDAVDDIEELDIDETIDNFLDRLSGDDDDEQETEYGSGRIVH